MKNLILATLVVVGFGSTGWADETAPSLGAACAPNNPDPNSDSNIKPMLDAAKTDLGHINNLSDAKLDKVEETDPTADDTKGAEALAAVKAKAQSCFDYLNASVTGAYGAKYTLITVPVCAGNTTLSSEIANKSTAVSTLCSGLDAAAAQATTTINAATPKITADFAPGKCDEQCPKTSSFKNAQKQMQDMNNQCIKIGAAFKNEMSEAVAAIAPTSAAGKSCLSHWKTGAEIAAGVGVVALGVAAYNRHQDANHRERLANDANNAIIHNSDGTTTDCKQTTTYSTASCQPALLAYCSKAQNTALPGCGAFTQYYCSTANASMAFCLSGSATSYCATPGPLTAQSPACQWISNLPASCTNGSNPSGMSSINCLSSQSTTQLASVCPSFPNDPLCQAYNAGKIVTNAAAGTTTAGTGTTTGGTSTALPVAGGTATQTSTGTPSAGGFVGVTARSANVNLFSGNSSALNSLCAQGHLVGCK